MESMQPLMPQSPEERGGLPTVTKPRDAIVMSQSPEERGGLPTVDDEFASALGAVSQSPEERGGLPTYHRAGGW